MIRINKGLKNAKNEHNFEFPMWKDIKMRFWDRNAFTVIFAVIPHL